MNCGPKDYIHVVGTVTSSSAGSMVVMLGVVRIVELMILYAGLAVFVVPMLFELSRGVLLLCCSSAELRVNVELR